ncbi:MAG: aconitate hydratase AcnA [Gemmatimonadetes bacterium]|nr:aconitate hydratase AcnA [Gemmatimonadota bacterium]
MTDAENQFGARATLTAAGGEWAYYRIGKLEEEGVAPVSRLPYSIRILLEAALRQCDGFEITGDDVERIARWSPETAGREEIPFKPARVVMQDFTGVPAVVDLAAMRDAVADLGGDPKAVNPRIPVDLVIDHSVQVDYYGLQRALELNAEREFGRNRERYEFLRWGQEAFANFRVVPPATGIVHQVNLEYLASVVQAQPDAGGGELLVPDSLVGTDSHTTMVNGLGVVGWGAGGIEAEAVMLGQPIYMLLPEVVGFRLEGEPPVGTTATDLVLTVTQMLRAHGVVGKFVEFFGPGLGRLSLADRATIANMAPEYGATVGLFPVDGETLRYLRQTGRKAAAVDRVRAYMEAQGMFYGPGSPDPVFSEVLSLDMGQVEPSLAGPARPQDRVPLREMKPALEAAMADTFGRDPDRDTRVTVDLGEKGKSELFDGAVVVAAITSCTNTSNPGVMLGAGLLARNAARRGLSVPPHVKTSLAPGSRVVTRYLEAAGLTEPLEALGFHTVGYGCTTCIGNSGPLDEPVEKAIAGGDLVVCSVLSGNRNFEGRVHPLTRANFLASPPLVVAYALAGRADIDFESEPLGEGEDGPVFLRDIWPGQEEIRAELARSVQPKMFEEEYANVFRGNEAWSGIAVPAGERYAWQEESTYIRKPTFFEGLSREPDPIRPIAGARVLARLGDSVTTDHISPAGSIAPGSPAARYLESRGVERPEWNSYGSRRGNHEVMVRGTFANIRIRNELVPGVEGGFTRHLPSNEQMTIYEAAERYLAEGVPTIVLAGREYGTGSSRDWAAKGPFLQGLRAAIAESFERIHRSNLIGMGVLPLQFLEGEGREQLGLTGEEVYHVLGLDDSLKPGQELEVAAHCGFEEKRFTVLCRIDTPVEIDYYRNGGILNAVLRRMAG